MPTYEYQAERTDGSTEQGVVFGTSLDGAARDLAAKGMRVTRIGLAASINDPIPAGFGAAPRAAAAPSPVERRPGETIPPAGRPGPTANPYDVTTPVVETGARPAPPTEQRSYMATSVVGPLVGRVNLTALAFFFRQAGTMLHAGVPIVQAMTTLSTQTRDPKLRTVLREISGHVEAGRPISAGMQRYPEVFTPVMLSMVRAGEEGGFLDRSLETVADYTDQEIELRNLYRRVTFYPKLQLVLSAIIILGANAIIASLKPGAKGLSSPLTTPATWLWLGPLIVAVFLFLRVGLANPRIKFNWDAIVSAIPYLGTTMKQVAMARFGRAFGALYRSGVPMHRALTLSADACGNEYLRSKMYPAYRKLETGAGLTETMRETGAFSPIVLDMVHTGETTGSLDQMLGKMSDFYIAEAKVRQTQLGYIVGAFVALLVAIYIGYIVITFYMGFGAEVSNQIKEAGEN